MSGRCPMCGDLGWVLDCNDLGKPGPRVVEFIECPYPRCQHSGQPIARVSFKGVKFTEVSRHPSEDYVMAVGEFDGTPAPEMFPGTIEQLEKLTIRAATSPPQED